MADLIRWNPYDEVTRMRDEFARIFSPFFSGTAFQGAGVWGPSVDVRETDTTIEVSAEIPGVNPGDLDIAVSDDSLTIRGEVKQNTNTNERGFQRVERRYGSFARTIAFPVAVKHDQAAADYHNGVLTITIPKAESTQRKVTKVKVQERRDQLQ